MISQPITWFVQVRTNEFDHLCSQWGQNNNVIRNNAHVPERQTLKASPNQATYSHILHQTAGSNPNVRLRSIKYVSIHWISHFLSHCPTRKTHVELPSNKFEPKGKGRKRAWHGAWHENTNGTAQLHSLAVNVDEQVWSWGMLLSFSLTHEVLCARSLSRQTTQHL